ncbi:MAG TPA: hypothetical protein VNN79_24935 [Actinomycetota bacterium]|nr:hypothetical protein [Actinomycetota bacterium]
MPVFQGFVRLRKHQYGRQQAFGTAVPATRAYPFSGTPDVNLNWTDPDINAGSLDPVAPPYRVAPDLTFPATIPALGYNTIPIIMCGFFGGAVSPTGGGDAKTWTHHPASATVDEPDVFTGEFGDDVLTDWYQFRDGILESFEITGPEGLGALSASLAWRFGAVASTGSTDSPVDGTVPTPGLDVDINEAIVYLKDMGIYIADNVAGLGAGQITHALQTFVLRGSHEVDQKRTADGTQTFDVAGYGPGARALELECTFAKTDDTVGTGSESDDWMSDQAVNRYVQLVFVSTVLAQSPSTFYGWTVTMPLRYYTRAEAEVGQNTAIVLTGHAFYDPEDFEGVFESVLVNTLSEAELGEAGS